MNVNNIYVNMGVLIIMMEYKKYGEKVSETKKFRVVGFFFLFI
jgi:hypothetical protein